MQRSTFQSNQIYKAVANINLLTAKNMRFVCTFLLILILSACNKDTIIEETITPVVDPPRISVNGTISGFIYDLEDNPLSEVVVRCIDFETVSNEEGFFEFRDVDLYEDGTLIGLEKDDFFSTSYKVNIQSNQINYFKFNLMAESERRFFDSNNGVTHSFDQASVTLPSGSYQLENGDIYDGEIQVSARWIDPSNVLLRKAIPGDGIGYALSDQLIALESYSAFVIELFSSSGERLELPENMTAQFEIPIPELFSTTAPDNIKTWFYDTDNAIWIESQQVQRQQEKYVGEFSKVTYWACSAEREKVELKGIINRDNMPFVSARIRVSDRVSIFSEEKLTASDGSFQFDVPANKELVLEIFEDCNNASQSTPLGILTEDEDIGMLDFMDNGHMSSISGTARDCQGAILPNAFVKLDLNDRKYLSRTDQSGQYQLEFSECHLSDVNLCVINQAQGKISESLSIPVATIINMPDLSACSDYTYTLAIDYDGMDWRQSLENVAEHAWNVSTIQAASKKFVVNPRIFNPNNGDEYMSGAFVFEENASQAEFILNFHTQGFKIDGVCAVERNAIGEQEIFRFYNNTTNVKVTDGNVYPGNVTQVNLDLSYFN